VACISSLRQRPADVHNSTIRGDLERLVEVCAVSVLNTAGLADFGAIVELCTSGSPEIGDPPAGTAW
jgi:hypothetical protein